MDYKTALERIKNSNCPVCNGSNTEYKNPEIMNNTAVQAVSCSDCDSKWIEYYPLIGIEIYETGIEDFDFCLENDLTPIENILEVFQAILNQKEILPTLLGIDEGLDKIIYQKLKK